mgnify:CR=1 FL=1
MRNNKMKTNLSPAEIHTFKWLYSFFDAIPASEWCQRATKDRQKYCAIGHLTRKGNNLLEITSLFERVSGAGLHTVNDAEYWLSSKKNEGNRAKTNVLKALKEILNSVKE